MAEEKWKPRRVKALVARRLSKTGKILSEKRDIEFDVEDAHDFVETLLDVEPLVYTDKDNGGIETRYIVERKEILDYFRNVVKRDDMEDKVRKIISNFVNNVQPRKFLEEWDRMLWDLDYSESRFVIYADPRKNGATIKFVHDFGTIKFLEAILNDDGNFAYKDIDEEAKLGYRSDLAEANDATDINELAAQRAGIKVLAVTGKE
jgi:hypothetical protein